MDRQQVHKQKAEVYERTIRDLHQDLDTLRAQLKASKEQASEPSSLLIHLQKELIDVKVSHLNFSYK